MALQTEIQLPNGLTAAEAYVRITAFEWNSAEFNSARYVASAYADEQAYTNGLPSIASLYHTIELTLPPSPEILAIADQLQQQHSEADIRTLVFAMIRGIGYRAMKQGVPELEGASDA